MTVRTVFDCPAYNSRMKGLAAAALAVAIALPACAQHGGGGHASFGGRGAPAAAAPGFHGGFAPSHGSFAPSAPFHYTGSAIAHAPVSYPSSMRLLAPGVRYPATLPPFNHPNFYHPGHGTTVTTTHNVYVRTYPIYPYGYAYPTYVYGYLPSDLLDDSFNNEASQQPPPEQQPEYGSAYAQPMPQPDGSYPQPAPQPEQGYYPQPMPAYPGYPQPQPAPEGAYAYPAPPPGYAVPPGYEATFRSPRRPRPRCSTFPVPPAPSS